VRRTRRRALHRCPVGANMRRGVVEGRQSTQLRCSPIAPARSLLGQEDAFPRPRLSARCRFSQGTFAGTRGNGRDAPIPDPSRPPRIGAVRPLAAARASRTHRVAFRSLAGRKPGNSGGRLAGTYLAERSPPPAGGSGACRCPANQLGHIECRDRPPHVRFAIGQG
jgi:hypothetical protein